VGSRNPLSMMVLVAGDGVLGGYQLDGGHAMEGMSCLSVGGGFRPYSLCEWSPFEVQVTVYMTVGLMLPIGRLKSLLSLMEDLLEVEGMSNSMSDFCSVTWPSIRRLPSGTIQRDPSAESAVLAAVAAALTAAHLPQVLLHPMPRAASWNAQLSPYLLQVNDQLLLQPSAVLLSVVRALHVLRGVLAEVGC